MIYSYNEIISMLWQFDRHGFLVLCEVLKDEIQKYSSREQSIILEIVMIRKMFII
jgi:hypothetical protein